MGYHLSGEVKSPSGQPMSNVQVTIHPEQGAEPDMKSRTDKSGKFSARLANGNYRVRADFDDKSVKLVNPEMEAAITHQNLILDAFVVQSFSVRGKVQTHTDKGKPFAKAKVAITYNGKTESIVTSSDGSFQVDNVRNGPISAKVSSEGFDFDTVTLNTVDPGVNFPVISPARYLLTGKVERDSLPVDTEVSWLSWDQPKSVCDSAFIFIISKK